MAVPFILGLLLQTLYMIADMVFVGMVSPESLVSLSFTMPLAILGLGITFGLGSGVTAVVARYVGAHDKQRADRAAQHAVALGLLLAATFTSGGLLFGRNVLTALGVPSDLLPLAWSYLRILAGGYVFFVLSVFFRSILTGEGNVRTPILILGAGTVANIILDPILIFYFDMGVAGAAASTIVSQFLAFSIFVYMLFFQHHAYVTFSWRAFRPSPEILREIIRIGMPASFSFIIMATGGGVFNRLLIAHSPEAVAAYQVGTRIDHVALLPLIAISASLVTLVGMFHGAGRHDLTREVTVYGITRAVAIASVLAVIFYIFAPSMVSIFSSSGEIHALASDYLRIIVFAYPLIAVTLPTGRALQGMGRGLPVLIITVLRMLLVAVPLAWFFLHRLGKDVTWVWGSMVAGALVAAIVAIGWLRSTMRQLA